MSFRYKSREKDRDDRKDRSGFGACRDYPRDREWERDWDRDNLERGSSNNDDRDRFDRDYRERERYRDREETSRERDRDRDRSRERERGDRDRDNREKGRDKERDRSYETNNRDSSSRDRDRYREREKGSNSRFRRNHGSTNVDEDNYLSYQDTVKDGHGSDRNSIQKWDWSCYKCGVNNFKRREQCFKCGTPREESAAAIEVGDEISLNPTNCLILRDLSPQTTEETILTALEQVTALPIKSIRIPRDPVYGSTRCICFVELHTTSEASQLFTLLCSSTSGFIVDGYPLKVCYAKRNVSSINTPRVSNVASVALAAAQWTNQSENHHEQSNFNLHHHQQQHPNNMTIDQLNSHESTARSFGVTTTQTKLDSNEQNSISLGTVSVNGVLYPKYPPPDTSTYQYDDKSGYYYDAATGLYYDANSHYYYNPTTQSYLFWDGLHSTYLPVAHDNKATTSSIITPQVQSNDTLTTNNESNGKNRDDKTTNDSLDDGKLGKQDKVMIAKKIAKDMEKWAKTLNQKKESSKLSQPTSIAFSSDEIEPPVPHSQPTNLNTKIDDHVSHEEPIKKRRIEYEQTIDSPEHRNEDKIMDKLDSEDSLSRSPNHSDSLALLQAQEQKLIDWDRLLCLLCKRQFNSKEQLLKHQQASDLHKSNLIKLGESRSYENQYGEPGTSSGDYGYRDRAKERRLKYGQPEVPDAPDISKRPISPPKFVEPKTVTGIGSKMLKAMGWSEGEGLGKGKPKTSIIEVERRASGVGIGVKATTTGVGESYKDAVKRASWLRFQELSKNE